MSRRATQCPPWRCHSLLPPSAPLGAVAPYLSGLGPASAAACLPEGKVFLTFMPSHRSCQSHWLLVTTVFFPLRPSVFDDHVALPLCHCPVEGGLRVGHLPPFGRQGTDRTLCPGVRQPTRVYDACSKMSEEFRVVPLSLFVGNLPEGYICNVTLPRDPRDQSTFQSRVPPVHTIPGYYEDMYVIPTSNSTCRIGERVA
jgi:hypothetical protein